MVMVAWVDKYNDIEIVEVDFTVRVIETQICEVWSIVEPKESRLMGRSEVFEGSRWVFWILKCRKLHNM